MYMNQQINCPVHNRFDVVIKFRKNHVIKEATKYSSYEDASRVQAVLQIVRK